MPYKSLQCQLGMSLLGWFCLFSSGMIWSWWHARIQTRENPDRECLNRSLYPPETGTRTSSSNRCRLRSLNSIKTFSCSQLIWTADSGGGDSQTKGFSKFETVVRNTVQKCENKTCAKLAVFRFFLHLFGHSHRLYRPPQSFGTPLNPHPRGGREAWELDLLIMQRLFFGEKKLKRAQMLELGILEKQIKVCASARVWDTDQYPGSAPACLCLDASKLHGWWPSPDVHYVDAVHLLMVIMVWRWTRVTKWFMLSMSVASPEPPFPHSPHSLLHCRLGPTPPTAMYNVTLFIWAASILSGSGCWSRFRFLTGSAYGGSHVTDGSRFIR